MSEQISEPHPTLLREVESARTPQKPAGAGTVSPEKPKVA
jgi:hypothetical protein